MKQFIEKTKTEVHRKQVLDYIECDICHVRCPTNQKTDNFNSDGYEGAEVIDIDLGQTEFHANMWQFNDCNKEDGMIVIAMRRMHSISEEPFELEMDVCPKCFRERILSLKSKR